MELSKFIDFSKLADMGKSVKDFIDCRKSVDNEILSRLDRIERRLTALGIIDDLDKEIEADV